MCAQNGRFSDGKEIEVLYDGDCPLCDREVRMLRRLDRKQRIRFTNIAVVEFEPGDYGFTQDELMAEIHARLPDGSWIRGVEVFRRIYSSLGWGRIVSLTRLPVVRNLLEGAYRLFARNRLRITGRCADDSAACHFGR